MNCLKFRILSTLLYCIGLICAGTGNAQNIDARLLNYPDSVIINGKIVSMDDGGVNENIGSTYQALAIRDGRILGLGTNEDIGKLTGPDTVVYDVKGRTVIPGIVDTHVHLWGSSQGHWGPPRDNEYDISAEEGDTWQDIITKTLDLVAGLKDKLEPNEWVLINWPGIVNGLNKNVAINTHKIMTRQMLDEANATQRIVITGNRGVFNTLGMETYGSYFAGNYPPEVYPENGIVVSATVDRLLFAEELYDLKTTIAMLGQELREWTAYGTTTWSSSIESTKQLTAVLALDAQGRLATRVAYGLGPTFYLLMKTHPYLGYDFGGYGTDMLWFNAWSTTSNDGAYPLLATTIEARPEIKERELLRSRIPITREYAAKGLRFGNTHVAGDRTLDVTMDLIEAGSTEGGLSLDEIRAKRHGSDHCRMNPRPDQIPRLAKLGIIMSCAPKYIDGDGPNIAADYGDEYLEWLVPMRSIIEGGVRAVFETDTHEVAGVGNFYYIGKMVNRENRVGDIVGASQAINRIWALKTATIWSPYYLHKEDVIGTLEEGKFADVVVLNKDYFNEEVVSDTMIKIVRPLMALVGGDVQYLDTGLATEFNTEPIGIQPEQLIRQIAEWETGTRR